MRLEGLQQLVAVLLVDRRLVGDHHPLGSLELLHVEDLRVEVGGVVDDDHHLGLGIEVHPRGVDDLLDRVGAGHTAPLYTRFTAGV